MASLLPSMIIFDLDFVLWPFWIDTHVTSPFFGKGQKIVDSTGQQIPCYSEVPRILDLLDRRGIRLAVAARIADQKGANQLMDSFDWSKFFTYTVTHPGAVTVHIKQLHLVSGIPYADMLYFNDEPRDLHQVERMGVLTYLVRDGMDLATIRNGLGRYEKNKTQAPFSSSYGEPRFRTFDKFSRPRGGDTFDRPDKSPIHTSNRPNRRQGDKLDRFRRPQKEMFDQSYEPQDDMYDTPHRPQGDNMDDRHYRPQGDKFERPYGSRGDRRDRPFRPRNDKFERKYQFRSDKYDKSENVEVSER